jgi:hypothetical protein
LPGSFLVVVAELALQYLINAFDLLLFTKLHGIVRKPGPPPLTMLSWRLI